MEKSPVNIIVVSGGVLSGTGKGIISSSLALLLWALGVSFTYLKCDGYLNEDCGTMNPEEHGEVFVTAEGGETDLDLGSVERFTGIKLSADNSLTGGKINAEIHRRERAGEYLGKTVRVVPHKTNLIKEWIKKVARKPVEINGEMVKPKVCIVEIGGSVGDFESDVFFEAIRQMTTDPECNMYFTHVAPLSYIHDEPKTRAVRESITDLGQKIFRAPDMLAIRCREHLTPEIRTKLMGFTNMAIVESLDVEHIHQVPALLKAQNVIGMLDARFNLPLAPQYKLDSYNELRAYLGAVVGSPWKTKKLTIGVFGKYMKQPDAYLSVKRAMLHAAFAERVDIEFVWISTRDQFKIEDVRWELLDGVLIPGGFGTDGILGLRKVARHCRENDIPCLGICLGMQVMVSEFYHAVTNRYDYSFSREWTQNPNIGVDLLIDLMPGQDLTKLGGTLRLGEYKCELLEGSKARELYGGLPYAKERHRHRYEISNKNMIGEIIDHGMIFSGTHDAGVYALMEICEMPKNRFHMGCQFHPEFNTHWWKPAPLFQGWMAAMAAPDSTSDTK